MPKQTKLEITRYEQISSARPLENSYYKKTRSSCEIENDALVLESGEIYTASPELVDWYNRSVYNSLAEDVTVIIDHEQKHASLVKQTENAPTPNTSENRQKIYAQIRQYTDELSEALDTIESIPPDNTEQFRKAELDLLGKVSSLAVMKKVLFEAMKPEPD